MSSVFDTLVKRGFVAQYTDEELRNFLAREKVTVYAGFDPTADSLHLGHVVPVMALAHMQRAGHKVIALVGGATGMIGDPSGRSSERNLQTVEQIAANVAGLKRQLSQFLDFEGDNPALILDNHEWISKFSLLDWLRDVGKHFSVNQMLAKDSVSRRIEGEQGISFTEFSYMTLQAFDFLHLFDTQGCTLQCGGSDQWGNITAGMDLIRKVRRAQAYGLTFQLVTTSDGQKFGKSAGNAVWLDTNRTSAWELFQYLVRQDDSDVMRLLNLFTFLPDDELAELEQSVATEPGARRAQKKLAQEVTALIHGGETASEMVRAAEIMYGQEIKDISESTLEAVLASVPSSEVADSAVSSGVDLVSLLVQAGMAASRGKAKQLIESGGVYINNVRVDGDVTVSKQHLATPRHIVLRTGKKNYHLLRVK